MEVTSFPADLIRLKRLPVIRQLTSFTLELAAKGLKLEVLLQRLFQSYDVPYIMRIRLLRECTDAHDLHYVYARLLLREIDCNGHTFFYKLLTFTSTALKSIISWAYLELCQPVAVCHWPRAYARHSSRDGSRRSTLCRIFTKYPKYFITSVLKSYAFQDLQGSNTLVARSVSERFYTTLQDTYDELSRMTQCCYSATLTKAEFLQLRHGVLDGLFDHPTIQTTVIQRRAVYDVLLQIRKFERLVLLPTWTTNLRTSRPRFADWRKRWCCRQILCLLLGDASYILAQDALHI